MRRESPKWEHLAKEHESRAFSYEILSNPETRRELVTRVSDLIEEARAEDVDTFVFLDKSARPLAWLIREMEDIRRKRVAKMFDEPVKRIPFEMKFVNIGTADMIVGGKRHLTESTGEHSLYGEEFAQEEVRNKLFKDEEDAQQWLSAADLPPSWEEGILEHEQEVQQIEEAFGKHLDGKNILVVDEIASSGKSIMTAIGLLSAACPRAEQIRGTALFDSESTLVGGRDYFRSLIPWFQQPGFSGIMESMDDDKLFSEPITQAVVEQVRLKLEAKAREEALREVEHIAGVKKALRDIRTFVRDAFPEITMSEQKVFDQSLDRINRAVEQFEANPVPENLFAKRVDKPLDAVRSLMKSLLSNSSKSFSAIEKMDHVWRPISTISWLFHSDVNEYQALLDTGYTSAKDMLAISKKLRTELKALAREAYSNDPSTL